MTKKYILKPGKHQFAPGSAAVHNNDNISDEEVEWYLARYPHIVSLFDFPASEVGGKIEVKKTQKVKRASSITQPSGSEESL